MGRRLLSAILIIVVVSSILVLRNAVEKARATEIYVPHDYPTIQEAINNAIDGDTIIVREGTYDEGLKLIINRSVSLIGQNSPTIGTGGGFCISVLCNKTTIKGFRFGSSSLLVYGNESILEANTLTHGISLYANNCTIKENIIEEGWLAIWGSSSSITSNTITSFRSRDSRYNVSTLYLYGEKNIIRENNISGGDTAFRLADLDWYKDDTVIHGVCMDNRIYHNNIINCTYRFELMARNNGSHRNSWDDNYPSGGNYWSDYDGSDNYSGIHQMDEGSDGIGDLPVIIDENNTDYYPLMQPYETDSGFEFSVESLPTCPPPFVQSDVPREGEPTQVRVNTTWLTDEMYLFYRVDMGEWWKSRAQLVNNDTWTHTIPGQMANSTVEFYLVARDIDGWTRQSGTYSYVVLDLLQGDINGDGTVNIIDITIAAAQFGKKT